MHKTADLHALGAALGERFIKSAKGNWQDYVSDDEADQYKNLIGRAQAKGVASTATGGALGAAAGSAASRLIPGLSRANGGMLGALVGGVGGARTSQKVFAKEDLRGARKIMSRGGRAHGKDVFTARQQRERRRAEKAKARAARGK